MCDSGEAWRVVDLEMGPLPWCNLQDWQRSDWDVRPGESAPTRIAGGSEPLPQRIPGRGGGRRRRLHERSSGWTEMRCIALWGP